MNHCGNQRKDFLGAPPDLGEHPVLRDDDLARIPHPVRVMVGDRDNTVGVEEYEGVAARLSSGSVLMLEDTPHPIERVSVDVVAATLRESFGASKE